MNREKYTRACEIFLELSQLPSDDRPARLRAECGADEELVKQVVELLEGDARADLKLTGVEGLPALLEERDGPASSVAAQALEAGTVVADYRLIERIGEGGMGQVWLAEQLNLGGRRVALKFVRPDRVSSHQLDLFAREARAGGRLQHPGIVAVFNSGGSRGLHWIAMEYIAGGKTLKDLIAEVAALDEVPPDHDREVARLVAEIADALQTAHDAGVVHRDVKPQNVLVTPDGQPKVMDFGIARILDETAITNTGEVAGTYFYMAPEQLAPEGRRTDQRADVFGLGVLLYELLALRRPFQGDTPHLIVRQILIQDPDDPRALRSRVPADLAVIAGKAMEKSPDRRYDSMSAFAADLRRHLANEPILARPPTRAYRAYKWARRHPVKSVSTAIVALALTVIAGLVLNDLRRELVLARQSADLGRLLDLQEGEDLIAAAAAWWPVEPARIDEYERWIASASELVARLHPRADGTHPGWIAELEQVRARAVPWAEVPAERKQAERAAHPRAVELAVLERELQSLRRAQEVRAGRSIPAEFELDPAGPDELSTLVERARALTGPDARLRGREAEALASTRKALELVDDDAAYAAAMEAHAWAAFRNGLDEEALESAREVVALAGALGGPQREHAAAALLGGLEAALAGAPAELADAEARLAALEAEVSEQGIWLFESDRDRLWHGQLVTLIAELHALEDERTGLLGAQAISPVHGWSVPKRLALAERLRDAHGAGGEFARRWSEALATIRRAHPELEPLTGLVPIGADPRSGLFEFWHVMSGTEPRRSADGSLEVSADSGLVFVLIPGSSFLMGAQAQDPDRGGTYPGNYDPQAEATEAPVHRVTLGPFLISKYELTQGQWERITGLNPSYCNPDSWSVAWNRDGGPREDVRRHPVEQITWQQCETVLARMGLVLPTEAQWELAARGGTSTPWWSGADLQHIEGAENLADARFGRTSSSQLAGREAWNDGYAVHAPVGSFRPNPYGLFDVLGNVFEWCRDEYDKDAYAASEAIDPLAPATGSSYRVNRGGSWSVDSARARVSRRGRDSLTRMDSTLGVRPARELGP